jgi:hypothetical protein
MPYARWPVESGSGSVSTPSALAIRRTAGSAVATRSAGVATATKQQSASDTGLSVRS